jgi:hypothetical protein
MMGAMGTLLIYIGVLGWEKLLFLRKGRVRRPVRFLGGSTFHLGLKYGTFWRFLHSSPESWRWEMSVPAQPHPDPDTPLIPQVFISHAYDDSIAKACIPLATASDTMIVLVMQLSTR